MSLFGVQILIFESLEGPYQLIIEVNFQLKHSTWMQVMFPIQVIVKELNSLLIMMITVRKNSRSL